MAPIALTSCLPPELLTWIISYGSYPTTLIVCDTRAAFLSSLQASTSASASYSHIHPQAQHQSSPPTLSQAQDPGLDPYPDLDGISVPLAAVDIPQPHSLLVPTLHQISISRHLTTIFTPTLSHLRAYLSIFPTPGNSNTSGPPPIRNFDNLGTKSPLLVVYGFVSLHRDTSEWSAQGLGSTTAALVEAGLRSRSEVRVLEQRSYGGDEEIVEWETDVNMDSEGKARRKRGTLDSQVWRDRMPMLNGSSRRLRIDAVDEGWSGRTVEVGTVLRRWFRFESGEWDVED